MGLTVVGSVGVLYLSKAHMCLSRRCAWTETRIASRLGSKSVSRNLIVVTDLPDVCEELALLVSERAGSVSTET